MRCLMAVDGRRNADDPVACGAAPKDRGKLRLLNMVQRRAGPPTAVLQVLLLTGEIRPVSPVLAHHVSSLHGMTS